MSNITPQEIKKEFLKSKMGIAGIVILTILILTSIITMIIIPIETFQEWNNPESWITYPKAAIPIWVNLFLTEKIPEHKILAEPNIETMFNDEINLTSYQFNVNFNYDQFPKDFIYSYLLEYSGSPLIQVSVIRPDGVKLELVSTSLPHSDLKTIHSDRMFSTDAMVKKELVLQEEKFEFEINELSVEDIVFSKTESNKPLKGNYVFLVDFYEINEESKIIDSKLIIGGKAFGIMGTDELRRDLAIGLLWGTPLALFIGLAVSIGSVVMGLGVWNLCRVQREKNR